MIMTECCKWLGALLPIIVIVFTLWVPAVWVKWLVVASGLIMLIHVFGCKKCKNVAVEEPKVKK